MRVGFGKSDITPRVGVELCGFGPYCCRHSVGIRDRLWARAMAVEQGGAKAVIVSCDLIGCPRPITRQVRGIVSSATGIDPDAIMVHCTHTHSGPSVGAIIGWGEADTPYLETLPRRIAQACIQAAGRLRPSTLHHAEVPCEGIGQNREYDRDALPLEEVLPDSWRPDKPELTDTTCHVLAVKSGDELAGFLSYFACHPVVCCQANRWIHGDYCGVATNALERENHGAIGLFLQGAQGDVNSCVVHKGEQESLLALDIIANRYACAVRHGLRAARPVAVDVLRFHRTEKAFSRRPLGLEKLRSMLVEKEALVHARDATDSTVLMETVHMAALGRLVEMAERGQSLAPPIEVHGLRLGPVGMIGSGFEIFQAVKNDVKAASRFPIPLVMGLVGDMVGYAPDRTAAARGGYAADMAPMIFGSLPYANIHDELVQALLDVDAALA